MLSGYFLSVALGCDGVTGSNPQGTQSLGEGMREIPVGERRWGGGTEVKGARDQGGRPGEGSWRELRALQGKEGVPCGESICHATVSEEGGELGRGWDWTLGVGDRERPDGAGARRRP